MQCERRLHQRQWRGGVGRPSAPAHWPWPADLRGLPQFPPWPPRRDARQRHRQDVLRHRDRCGGQRHRLRQGNGRPALCRHHPHQRRRHLFGHVAPVLRGAARQDDVDQPGGGLHPGPQGDDDRLPEQRHPRHHVVGRQGGRLGAAPDQAGRFHQRQDQPQRLHVDDLHRLLARLGRAGRCDRQPTQGCRQHQLLWAREHLVEQARTRRVHGDGRVLGKRDRERRLRLPQRGRESLPGSQVKPPAQASLEGR